MCSPFSAHRNEALSILTSYNDLNNRIIVGTLSTDEETRSKQQIGSRFLMCLNRFKEDIPVSMETGIKSDDSAQSLPIHLLVKLKPSPFTRDMKGHELFTVEIYTWKSSNDNDCKLRKENCLLADIRKELDAFISELNDDEVIKTIEFILPCELITLDVDQWIMEEGRSFKIKFGKKYRVLARLDRRFAIHRPKQKVPSQLRQDWKKLWKLFNNYAHESSVFWVYDHQTYDPENLCEDFTCSEDVSCLFMTFMPPENHDGKGLGDIILDTGIPVALCYRKNSHNIGNPDIIENKMKIIASEKGLSDLPTLIRNERRKAKQEEDIGNHLTLIWDDPNKIPMEDREEDEYKLGKYIRNPLG